MSARVIRIVLFPRFTTFVGKTSGSSLFPGTPFNVRAFANADLVVWMGRNDGAGSSLSFKIQESPDLLHWSDLATLDASEFDEEVTPVSFRMDWVRLLVTATDGARFTCWVQGDFTAREE